MATAPEAKVRIVGDDSAFRQALRDGASQMKRWSKDLEDGPLSAATALRDRFLLLTAVLGGGALFGRAVSETVAFTERSIQLGKAMGQNASEAGSWLAILDNVGASEDELGGAMRGLVKNINTNESGLRAMGLATRDANGHLRPMNELMVDAIALTNQYADGTDRQLASAQIFGKGVDASSNLFKVNTETVRENMQAQRELGLVLTNEGKAAYEAYDAQSDRMSLTMRALMNVIGTGLMPALTEMASWFNSAGPTAVAVLRGAIGSLNLVFWSLREVAVGILEGIRMATVAVTGGIVGLAEVMGRLIDGDFAGAVAAWKRHQATIVDMWGESLAKLDQMSADTMGKIRAGFATGTEISGPVGTGTRRATPKSSGNDANEKAGASSYMGYYEAMLTEEKRALAQLDAGREYTKQQELAFWRYLQENLQMTSADKLAVQRKTAGLELEIARQTAQQREQIDRNSADTQRELALGRVDAERLAARALVESGQITKGQLAMLEVQYEDQRHAIVVAAMRERLRVLELDPEMNPVEMARIKNELLLIEQQHQLRRGELMATATQKNGAPGDALTAYIGSPETWGTLFNGILDRTTSFLGALRQLWAGAAQVFMLEMISKPFAAWVANQAHMLLVKLGFAAEEKAASKLSAISTIMEESGKAGAGGVASMAAAPFPLNLSAPAFGAAMAAAALAYLPAASARGGYDIPAGVNPLTQLHAREMVLPARYAEVIRGMAGDGGSTAQASPGSEAPVYINTTGGDFIHKRDLARLLTQMKRNFAFVDR